MLASTFATPPKSLDEYQLLGHSGLRVSPLCLGTMTFGTDWGYGAEAGECRRMLDAYADRGGNFIDTANRYTNGTSESLLGQMLEGRRDRFVLSTKYTLSIREGDPNACGNHRKNMVQSLEASLRRLGTDYIDLYWVHAWEYRTPVEEVMRALDDLVRQGKVLYLGISDTPAWKVAQANTLAELRGWTPFIAAQFQYSLADRSVEREIIPMACEMGLGCTPWGVLGRGLLSGKYGRNDLRRAAEGGDGEEGTRWRTVAGTLTEDRLALADTVREIADEVGHTPAQVALAWMLRRPGVTSPIIGARTLGQLEENMGCLEVALSEELEQRLEEASAIELGFPHDFLTKIIPVALDNGATIVPSPLAQGYFPVRRR